MTITPQAYADLEEAVGPRFVSKDSAKLFGIAWNCSLFENYKHDLLLPPSAMPLAVVMPSTVEEVAAVVKACNRHDMKFRAFSVGWGNMSGPTQPNTVCIDLRRMADCEIDEHNMVATIGPYVTAGQLMAEAMQKGLTCHVVGAGATHSPLASATSLYGIGISGSSIGHNARNLLSLEWVTPEGEIVRIGSAGSDLGWAISDGPGPGFRGMIRGFIGAASGLGVFTRIGYRLHPWHGGAEVELTGQHPQTGMKLGQQKNGRYVRFYHAIWLSWAALQKATFEFNASAVATVQLRIPPESIGWTLTRSNNEYLTQVEREDLPAIARQENGISWSILTTGYSEKQDAYNDKVVRHIVERTGGRFLEVAQDHAEVMARALATSVYVPRVLRPAPKLNTSFGVFDSFRLLERTIETTKEVYAAHGIAEEHFHTVGKEQNWIWPTERRTLWTENIIVGTGDEFVQPMFEYSFRHEDALEKKRLGFNAFLIGPAMDLVGSRWGPNVEKYQRKIKNLYDPRNLADHFLYVTPKAMPGSWGWKIMKRFIYRPLFRPILQAISRGAGAKEKPK